MEQQQKAQIGERIRELREASPHTNRSIADELDVSERAVAKWIAGGGITWDNVEAIAKLFDVEPHYIWSGTADREETPDLMGALSTGGADRLDELERLMQEGIQRLDQGLANQTKLLSDLAQVRLAQEEMQLRLGRIERNQGDSRHG
jgi:transcriptional regulator with XRE-family HTH domain